MPPAAACAPLAVSGGLRFRRVSAEIITCGLSTGDGSSAGRATPASRDQSAAAASSAPLAGTQISPGPGRHRNLACAISVARDLFCWGAGYLGNGNTGIAAHRAR